MGYAETERRGRPEWLRNYIPELDGLRGLAVLAVVFYHCERRLAGTPLFAAAQWGWAGVNLFFVLSGFLITGIILDSRDDPKFFRNFYARRALRIWPVYVLLLVLNYILVPLLFYGSPWWAWHEMKAAPWPYLVLFVQNLFALTLPGTIGPTWSLAIEEQFYVVWAPLARWMSNRTLVAIAIAVVIASPFVRMWNHGALTPTHTLIHLDGLAFGALISVALRTFSWTRATWMKIATAAMAVALPTAVWLLYGGSAFSDSALAMVFASMLVFAVCVARGWYSAALRWRPLAFYGRISYGLYMIHILTFVLIGRFDLKMDAYGMWGNFAVVLVRFALSTAVATAMWYGFERPILRLKKRFEKKAAEVQFPAAAAVATAD